MAVNFKPIGGGARVAFLATVCEPSKPRCTNIRVWLSPAKCGPEHEFTLVKPGGEFQLKLLTIYVLHNTCEDSSAMRWIQGYRDDGYIQTLLPSASFRSTRSEAPASPGDRFHMQAV